MLAFAQVWDVNGINILNFNCLHLSFPEDFLWMRGFSSLDYGILWYYMDCVIIIRCLPGVVKLSS